MDIKTYIEPRKKFGLTLDALFATNISQDLPLDDLEFVYSKKTGKIRHVLFDNQIIATLRTDGGFALTVDGAKLLLKSNKVRENCVIVKNDVAEFIKEGRSVFCKHVIFAGRNIKVNSEVIILDEGNNLLGVGKAILTAKMIKEFDRGVAVKVRDTINY